MNIHFRLILGIHGSKGTLFTLQFLISQIFSLLFFSGVSILSECLTYLEVTLLRNVLIELIYYSKSLLIVTRLKFRERVVLRKNT